MKVILASVSKQRRRVLETLGVEFSVVASNLNEDSIVHADPTVRVVLLAEAKGKSVAQTYPDDIIIAGDSYCVFEGKSFQKPINKEDAKSMLRQLSGKEVQVLTGFYYRDPENEIEVNELFDGVAQFRDLSDREIERYVMSNPVEEWSGAYSPAYLEGLALFGRINASLTAFASGLPIERVAQLLKSSRVLD